VVSARELKENAQGVSLLYVEDEKELRDNTIRLLSNFFTHIDVAEDGQDGLDKYKRAVTIL